MTYNAQYTEMMRTITTFDNHKYNVITFRHKVPKPNQSKFGKTQAEWDLRVCDL